MLPFSRIAASPEEKRPGSPDATAPFPSQALVAFRNFLRRRLPDHDTADDVLQQALLKAWESKAFDGKENAVAWFYRVLRNAVADFYRDRAVREKRDAHYAAAPVFTENEAYEEICACFGPLLAELRPEYAEILRLTDFEGRDSRGTAATLGISPGNLHVRLHRARAALRARLKAACGPCSVHGCFNCTCRSDAGSSPAPHLPNV